MPSTHFSELSAALPDLSDSIATFAFCPDSSPVPEDGVGLDFVLRVSATGKHLKEGDFLCRAYPFVDGGAAADLGRCSWSRSPNFEALYAYLPAFSGSTLIPLPRFEADGLFDGVVLAVQPWRQSAGSADVSVGACLLRWEKEYGGAVCAGYHLVPPLPADA